MLIGGMKTYLTMKKIGKKRVNQMPIYQHLKALLWYNKGTNGDTKRPQRSY